MMSCLAAAANGQTQIRDPHLVSAVRGVAGHGSSTLELAVSRFGLDDAKPGRLAHDAAEVVLSGLSYSHRAGTARLACEQVFDARHVPRHRLDRRQDGDADVSQRRSLA